jgi:hypothetical protein
MFLDGDCIPQRDFIARHRALSEPGYLVSGSRILLSERLTRRVLDEGIDVRPPPSPPAWPGACAARSTRCCSWPCAGRTSGACASRFSWRRIKSCNLAVWRSDLERVNGFDESFTGWGHEDSDLVVRLFHAGVMRKDGAFATEVFHLWHREAQRDQESSNRGVVLERAASKVTQATVRAGAADERLERVVIGRTDVARGAVVDAVGIPGEVAGKDHLVQRILVERHVVGHEGAELGGGGDRPHALDDLAVDVVVAPAAPADQRTGPQVLARHDVEPDLRPDDLHVQRVAPGIEVIVQQRCGRAVFLSEP